MKSKLEEYFEQQLNLVKTGTIKYTGEEAFMDALDVTKNYFRTATQLSSQQMRWVKASERLPDYDIPVLWLKEDGSQFIEMLDKDGNDWLYEMELSPSKVTHWMPLPAEPTHNNQNQ